MRLCVIAHFGLAGHPDIYSLVPLLSDIEKAELDFPVSIYIYIYIYIYRNGKVKLCLRGEESTAAMLHEHFRWEGLVQDVSFFVDRCLHGAGAAGSLKRPLGSAIHGTKPNDVIP